MQVIKKPDSATNTEIAHGPSHGAPQWDRITLRKATARSPCKDEISFLSVTVSSVLPKIAAAVFFTSVISIKKAACSVKKYAESVFPIRRSTACAPRSTAPDSSVARVCMQSMRIPLHQRAWNDVIRKIEECILEYGGINS